jgi:hypothetical protein
MLRTLSLRSAASILAIVLPLAACGETVGPEPAERVVYAVGEGGTVLLFDGDRWTPLTTGAGGVVEAVWGTAEDDVHALTRTHLWHFDGAGWSATTAEDTGETWGRLRGVGGTSSFRRRRGRVRQHRPAQRRRRLAEDGRPHGPRTAASTPSGGARRTTSSPSGTMGVIGHFDGDGVARRHRGRPGHPPRLPSCGTCGGRDRPTSTPSASAAAGPSSSTSTVLAGRRVEHPAERPLEGVWGASASDVFAVGMEGTILHYDGAAWRAMQSPTTETLMDVWGTSPEDVFAVGHGGTILHYDGTVWRAMESGTDANLWGVWGAR